MITTVCAAIALFAVTNIDDIFVLLGLFADPRLRAREVVLGQYLGIAVLVAVSFFASLISLVLAPAYVGLLGVLPILIGLKKLYDIFSNNLDEDGSTSSAGFGNTLAVSAVTLANGGDNIGVYTPVFATSSAFQIGIYVAVFVVMVALWLVAANGLVRHPMMGTAIRRFGPMVVPFVLIAIGALVIHEADSLSLLKYEFASQ